MLSFVIPLRIVFALIIGAPQQDSRSTESQATMKEQAHDEYERHKQSAIRINELAGRIQSEADASAVVMESRVFSQKNCPRLGPTAVSVSELPTLSMSRFATR
jgi:hypothetical protein